MSQAFFREATPPIPIPNDQFGTIGPRLSLPAGTYLLIAKSVIHVSIGTANRHIVECNLTAHAPIIMSPSDGLMNGVDNVTMTTLPATETMAMLVPVTSTAVVSMEAPFEAALICNSYRESDFISMRENNIVAIRMNTATVQ